MSQATTVITDLGVSPARASVAHVEQSVNLGAQTEVELRDNGSPHAPGQTMRVVRAPVENPSPLTIIAPYVIACNQRETECRSEGERLFQTGGRSRLVAIAARTAQRLDDNQHAPEYDPNEDVQSVAALGIVIADSVFRTKPEETATMVIVLLLQKRGFTFDRPLWEVRNRLQDPISRRSVAEVLDVLYCAALEPGKGD